MDVTVTQVSLIDELQNFILEATEVYILGAVY